MSYPYQYNQGYHGNFSYQQPVETKVCQRARGPHTEGEIYCGRTLPLNYFSKGRAQCKECSSKKTKVYNETKIATLVQKHSEQVSNPELEDSLRKVTLELEEMKVEYKKYYDGALQYHNENLRLVKELEALKEQLQMITRTNNDLIGKSNLLVQQIQKQQIDIEERDRTVSNLRKENVELRKVMDERLVESNRKDKVIASLNDDIKALNDEIRVLERKR